MRCGQPGAAAQPLSSTTSRPPLPPRAAPCCTSTGCARPAISSSAASSLSRQQPERSPAGLLPARGQARPAAAGPGTAAGAAPAGWRAAATQHRQGRHREQQPGREQDHGRSGEGCGGAGCHGGRAATLHRQRLMQGEQGRLWRRVGGGAASVRSRHCGTERPAPPGGDAARPRYGPRRSSARGASIGASPSSPSKRTRPW